ncbi:hypothetical protein [Agromyces sp. Marseille-P2726]|uniref:hypothetical protein n=1 Tax=Agromyces sp. Marseille-P2726 TaxID=2709132 RepID=UPI0015704549|nr:hypothetical protein [Agromyces sp. Marseille-P2726]
MQAGSDTRVGWPGIVLVWALAVVGAVVVVALAYSRGAEWTGESAPLGAYAALGMVFAASVIAAMVVQLMVRRTEGLVTRVSWSVAGAALVMLVAAALVAPIALGSSG